MKRFSVSCTKFALPVATLFLGLHTADSAHAAGRQTNTHRFKVPSHAVATPGAQIAALDTATTATAPADADAANKASLRDPATPDNRQVECVAKVIVHEAGNQLHRGQVAVAQVIRTRMKRLGLATDACHVVHQPGQFFNVDRYAPARDTATWRNAVAIAIDTLKGEGEEIVPGALFFRPAGRPIKGRERIAQIDNHVFYR